ncbi:MAG TPA: fibronectin type III domain-containing protein, partial [Candidatus Caenarcaniphilales bacterium]|nr:fibronectin type III domain-containing protein [Candidatus Caenarcaniphilales bacterium]
MDKRRLLSALVSLVTLAGSAPPALAATGPTAHPPDVSFVVGNALGLANVPVRVAWPEATPGDAAIESYKLEHQLDRDATWQPLALASALSLSATVMLRPGTLNRFRVRAQDTTGRLTDWAYGPELWLALVHEYEPEIVRTGTWRSKSITSAYAGALAFSREAGADAAFEFSATRLAWVAPRGPRQGRAY